MHSRIAVPAFLAALNAIAHFVPFERAALSPDDYYTLSRSGLIAPGEISRMATLYPTRPLYSVLAVLQAKLFSDTTLGPLLLLFLASTLLLCGVHALLILLLRDRPAALTGAVLFTLLPNKLEVFQGSLFVVRTLSSVLYVLCMILFLHFAKSGRSRFLYGSLLAYTLALFSEETGFFSPAFLAVYCALFAPRRLRWLAPFAVPAAIYASYRLWMVHGEPTVGFGIQSPLVSLFHGYGGGYLALAVLNGLDRFLVMAHKWLLVALSLDLILLLLLWPLLRRLPKPIDRRLLWLAAAAFILFLAPLFLRQYGGIAGRHLVLPSIGVVLALLALLAKLGRRSSVLSIAVVALGLVVSQGNAWAQVVACRINARMYAVFKERGADLQSATSVVIDVASFARSIPAWLPPLRPKAAGFSFLNTYYGAQAFENWSLASMVQLASGNRTARVHLAVDRPESDATGRLEFLEGYNTGSRSLFHASRTVLPTAGTVVIRVGDVFPVGFPPPND